MEKLGSAQRRHHARATSRSSSASSSTIRNIHFYDKNFNNESETVIKNAFYDENLGFVIDHRDEPRTPLIYDEIGYRHKKNITEQHNISS